MAEQTAALETFVTGHCDLCGSPLFLRWTELHLPTPAGVQTTRICWRPECNKEALRFSTAEGGAKE